MRSPKELAEWTQGVLRGRQEGKCDLALALIAALVAQANENGVKCRLVLEDVAPAPPVDIKAIESEWFHRGCLVGLQATAKALTAEKAATKSPSVRGVCSRVLRIIDREAKAQQKRLETYDK